MIHINSFIIKNDVLAFEANNALFTFKKIRSAEFMMGATDFRRDTYPPHKVMLSKDYWMQETLVTQKQWIALGGTPMEKILKDSEFDTYNGVGDDYPVYLVSWNEAVDFCNKLTVALREFNAIVSLPTEAEWEYACRAESYMPYSFGDTCDGSQINCNGKFPYGQGKTGIWREKATSVFSHKPNPWGLYDMHGNLWEWCKDWYSESYYQESPYLDPCGPDSGINKVVRGGSWRSHAECCRSAFRDQDAPNYRGRTCGFRTSIKII